MLKRPPHDCRTAAARLARAGLIVDHPLTIAGFAASNADLTGRPILQIETTMRGRIKDLDWLKRFAADAAKLKPSDLDEARRPPPPFDPTTFGRAPKKLLGV